MKIKRFNQINEQVEISPALKKMKNLQGQTIKQIHENPHSKNGYIFILDDDVLEIGFDEGHIEINDQVIL